MGEIRYPEWQKPYRDAMLELDPAKLPEQVSAAETAIFLRLQALESSPDGATERQAIAGALEALRIVKRDKLRFPDWTDGAADGAGDGAGDD